MNEHSQRFVILNRVRSNPNEAAEKIARESLPVCNDPVELLEFANARTDQSFRTPSEVLNEMLRTKFLGLGITEFMEIYTKLHVGQAFAFPTPPTVTCTFKEMDTAESVQNFLSGHQRRKNRYLSAGIMSLYVCFRISFRITLFLCFF